MSSTATGFTPDLDDLQIVAEYSASGTGEDSTLYVLARKMSNNNFCEGLDRAMHIYIAKSRMSTKFIMNKLMEKAK